MAFPNRRGKEIPEEGDISTHAKEGRKTKGKKYRGLLRPPIFLVTAEKGPSSRCECSMAGVVLHSKAELFRGSQMHGPYRRG